MVARLNLLYWFLSAEISENYIQRDSVQMITRLRFQLTTSHFHVKRLVVQEPAPPRLF
jgi:hypothetical protein